MLLDDGGQDVTVTTTCIIPRPAPLTETATVTATATATTTRTVTVTPTAPASSTTTSTPTPAESGVVYGSSDGDWPINGVSKLDGIRIYLGGGGLNSNTSWTSTGELSNGLARVNNGGTVWFSIKDNNAAQLDRVLKQFDTVTAGRNLTLVVTYRHEPENDVKLALSDPAKQADIDSYQNAWANLLPVIHANGDLAATCLLGDRVSPDKPNNPESVAYHVKGVDIIGFDRYNPGLGNATNYVSPTTVLAGVLQYTLNRSAEDGRQYDLGIGEWGTIAIGSDSEGAGGDKAGQRTWAQGYVDRLAAIDARPDVDVPVALWWNQSRMELDDDTTGQLAQIVVNN